MSKMKKTSKFNSKKMISNNSNNKSVQASEGFSSKDIVTMIFTGINFNENFESLIIPFAIRHIKAVIKHGEKKLFEEVISLFEEKRILFLSGNTNNFIQRFYRRLWNDKNVITNQSLVASLKYSDTDEDCQILTNGNIIANGNIIIGKFINVSRSGNIIYTLDENFLTNYYCQGVNINPVLFDEAISIKASSGAVFKLKPDFILNVSYRGVSRDMIEHYKCIEKQGNSIACYQMNGNVDVFHEFPYFSTYLATKYDRNIDPFLQTETPKLYSITTNGALGGFSEEELTNNNDLLSPLNFKRKRQELSSQRKRLIPMLPPPLFEGTTTMNYLSNEPPPLFEATTTMNYLSNKPPPLFEGNTTVIYPFSVEEKKSILKRKLEKNLTSGSKLERTHRIVPKNVFNEESYSTPPRK